MAMHIKFLMFFLGLMMQTNPKQANRCLYIFADNAGNINVAQQLKLLKADPNGLAQRSITYTVINYSAANAQHYKKWRVSNAPFTVILIGKDNGEKLRSHEPVTTTKLYDLIDNMAFRREEIRYKH